MSMRWIAAVVVWLAAVGPATANEVYRSRTPESDTLILADPFTRTSLTALASLPRVQAAPGLAGSVKSMSYTIGKDTFVDPQTGNRVFNVTRTFVFDGDLVLEAINSAADGYRKSGCSKRKISYPEIVALSQHTMRVRLNFSYKKRACGSGWATNVASASGHMVLGIEMVEGPEGPVLDVRVLSQRMNVDRVLGMSTEAFVPKFIGQIASAVGLKLGAANLIRGTIGDIHFRVANPARLRASADAANYVQQNRDLSHVITRYGSLARVIGYRRPDLLQFSKPRSGFFRRPLYVVKPEFSGRVSTNLCGEIGATTLGALYCQPSGRSELVLVVSNAFVREETTRELIVHTFNREFTYLHSFSEADRRVLYPASTPLPSIVMEQYGSLDFADFFRRNNPNPPCVSDTITPAAQCEYVVQPAWRMRTDL